MEFVPVKERPLNKKRKKVNVLKSGKPKPHDREIILKSIKDGKPVKETKNTLKNPKKSKFPTSETNLLNIETRKPKSKILTNRLFVNMKKKIMNDVCVKELHPDIISVTFPRKKLSRWCWAVFESTEKAKAALTDLEKRTDVIVRYPQTDAKKVPRKEKKFKKVKEKKLVKTELLKSWL